MQRRIQSLENRIEKIKRQLAQLGDLRPGSLSKQYNVCGNPNCKCKATPPKKHGPYYQLSSTRKGKSRSKFVRKEDIAVTGDNYSSRWRQLFLPFAQGVA